MMWGYFDGGNWLWMAGMMVLFWGGIIVLAVVAFRAFTGTKSDDPAMDVPAFLCRPKRQRPPDSSVSSRIRTGSRSLSR